MRSPFLVTLIFISGLAQPGCNHVRAIDSPEDSVTPSDSNLPTTTDTPVTSATDADPPPPTDFMDDTGSDSVPVYIRDSDTPSDSDMGNAVEYDTSVDADASFDFDFSGLPFVGMNLSGPEWDGSASTSSWPNQYLTKGYESYLKYFRGWGMTMVRLPFKWEYLQPELSGEFDEAEFEELKITVFQMKKYRAKVLIDMHNYARYRGNIIGSDEVSYDDYADAWRRLAETFKPYPEVMFGIMNEPHDMSTAQWVTAANAAIAAIRSTGAENLIFVNGNGWSGAHSWTQDWTDLDRELTNAEAMLQIEDPLGDDKLVFEVHQYLDEISADWGICECRSDEASAGCTDETVGSHRMRYFTQWLHDNDRRGFLGEFGSYDDVTCTAAMDDMLNHVEENDTVYVGWAWWGAGPGCSSWQVPIDPYCWGNAQKETLEEEGVEGNGIPGQVKLLNRHLDTY